MLTPVATPSHEPALPLEHGLAQAMRAASLDQFDRMLDALDGADPDEGVHTARKAMKRQRALLRLVRDEIGYPAYRNENVVLRDVARRLAPVRDGYVLLQTLAGLHDEFEASLSESAFAATYAYLDDHYRRSRQAVLDDPALLGHVRVSLATARTRLRRWDPTGEPATALAARPLRDEFAAIAPGVERVYRRGRRAWRRAYRDGTELAFHDWRKRVKYLGYQMEALLPLWPEMVGAYAARLDRLGELLGAEHDLAVLGEVVRLDAAATGDQRERTLLLALVHRRRLELQWEAHPLGRSLYVEKPKHFVARLETYWHTAG